MKILLIEDDPDTAGYVANGLRENSHLVEHAANGRDGLFLASGGGHDMMVVDRMLPGVDGLAIVKTIRVAGLKVPVLMLTNLGGINDRAFAFAELLARINALARRPPIAPAVPVLKVADLELDRLKRTVTRGGRLIELQPQEFKLLEYLMRNAEQLVTRTMLLENVWDFHFDPRTSVVETHISRLRAKVDREFGVELIHTLRGSGYCIREPR